MPAPAIAQRAASTRLLVTHAKAAGVAKRRRPMPVALYPRPIERDYQSLIVGMVRAARTAAYAPVLVELPHLLASAARAREDAAPGRRHDEDEPQRARQLLADARRHMERALAQHVNEAARKVGGKLDAHAASQLGRQTKAVLGIEVGGNDAKVKPLVDGFVAENVALITSIPVRLHADIEAAVLRGITTGQPHGDLARDLATRFGIADRRAETIAVDQVGKLNSQVAVARAQSLGVTHFYWRTTGDERVRGNPAGKYPKAVPSHWARDGQRYSYADPPKGRNGEKELPGMPVRCRCSPEPDLESVLVGVDEAPLPVGPGDERAAREAQWAHDYEVWRAARDAEVAAREAQVAAQMRAQVAVAARAMLERVQAAAARAPFTDVATLATASVLGAPRELGGGVNATFTIELDHPTGPRRAVWKPAKTSRDEAMFDTIPTEGEHLRERAASDVASLLGVGDIVPPTTTRTIDGVAGSVAAWAVGTPVPSGMPDLDGTQRMRAFDFVIGNVDRHGGNVLWDAQNRPILIDHGLVLPEGAAERFLQPGSRALQLPDGAITPAVAARIAAVDETALATTLHRAGIKPEAIRHTLYRLRVLQADPQILAYGAEHSANPTAAHATDRARWEAAATRAHYRLSDEQRAAVDAVVRSATKR